MSDEKFNALNDKKSMLPVATLGGRGVLKTTTRKKEVWLIYPKKARGKMVITHALCSEEPKVHHKKVSEHVAQPR